MRFIKLPIVLILVYFNYAATEDNDTTIENHRKERVNGRIVKLYAGNKTNYNVCHKEGFQADFEDCSVFYRCLKGNNEKYTVFRFQCAPGTIFDPDKEVCNYPQNTRRSDCGGQSLSTEEKHTNEIQNISQELPQPIKTTEVPQNYLPSNSPLSLVNYNELLDNHDPIPHYPSNPNHYDSSTTSPTTLNKVTQSNLYHQNNQKGDPCLAHGFMGDTRNCKKFYRCVNNLRGGFVRYEFLCSDATVWDDNIQGCNHAWLVRNTRCGRGSTYSESIDDTFGNKKQTEYVPVNVNNRTQSSYESTVSYLQPQVEDDLIQSQNQMYDKTTLTVIDSEPTQKLSTQSTTIGYTSAQIHYGDHDKSTSHPEFTENQSYINTIVYKEEDIKPLANKKYTDKCYKNGFFGYSDNCNKFYRCVENGKGSFTKYEFSCSESTVWDDNLKACNFAWAVKECGSKSLENKIISTTESHNYNTFSSEIGVSDVDVGYVSLNKQSSAPLLDTPKVTPSSSIESTTTSNDVLEQDYDYGYKQKQDKNTFSTENINKIVYKPVNINQNKCTEPGFMGDSIDCNKFYRCVDSGKGIFIQYEFSCGEGTVWDSRIESCNHAWAVEKCGQNSENNGYGHKMTVSVKPTTNADQIEYNHQGYHETTDTNKFTSLSNGPNIVTFQPTQATNIYVSSTILQPLVNTGSPHNVDKILTKPGDNCLMEGFYPQSEDCRKFYRCVSNGAGGYDKYDFTCGEGTAWDVRIKSCNHVENVKTCYNSQTNEKQKENNPPIINEDQTVKNTTTSTTNTPSMDINNNNKPSTENTCERAGYFGDVNDCKKFYRCVDDNKGGFMKYDYTCGEGTIWDQDITACNHPRDVEISSCSPKIPDRSTISTVDTSSPSSTSKTSAITDSSPITQSSTKREEGVSAEQTTIISTSSLRPSSSDTDTKEKCNEEGFFGSKNDCKDFYRCVYDGKNGFIKYDFNCGEGTIWDEDITACNHPSAVKRPSCSTEDPNSSSISSVETSSLTTTSKTSTITDSSSMTQSSTEREEGVSAEQTTIISTSSLRPSSSDTDTHQKCNEEGFFGNKNDCKSFYRCVYDGKNAYIKYDFTCGEGTIWDQDIIVCNHPKDVEHPSCSLESTTGSETTTTDLSTSSGSTTEKVRTTTMIMSSSSSQSTTAEATTVSTVSNNKQNSTTQQSTEQTSTISTSTSSTAPTPTSHHITPSNQGSCSEEGFFGNSDDCKKFYRCVYNGKDGFIKYDFTCGEGTIWDQDITTCNHPGDVENPSCSPESTDYSPTTSKEYYSSTDSTTTTSTRHPSSSIASTSTESSIGSTENNVDVGTTEHQEGNFTCTQAGFYPNPNDCKKFYRCVDWKNDGSSFSIFHFECGEGTLWDPSLDTCNYEDSVYLTRNCSGSQTQNHTETTTTESTTTQSTTKESTTSESTTMSTEPTKTTVQQTTTSKQTTTQEVTSTETTTTQQSTSTEKSTTSSTNLVTSPTSTQETTTTDRTTSTEQTTQPDKVTEESTTSDGTTQQSSTEQSKSTTEQQSPSTDQSSSTTEQQSSTTTEQSSTSTERSTSTTEQQSSSTEQSTSTTEQQSTSSEQTTSTTEQQSPSTEQSTSTTEQQSSSTTDATTESSTNNKCPDMDDNQSAYICPTSFRRHPKYCNLFYQCTEDDDTHDLKIALFHCPNDTIYDESKTQCVNESKSEKKCDGTLAKTHRIKRLSDDYIEAVTVDKKSYACPGTGYFPFEANQDCSPAFLKCQRNKSKGYVFKCPKGYTFWAVSKRCERIARVGGCKRSDYAWDKRHDIPTEIRNVAP